MRTSGGTEQRGSPTRGRLTRTNTGGDGLAVRGLWFGRTNDPFAFLTTQPNALIAPPANEALAL